jgi:CBS domain containing-hemolysin-like protein
MNQNFVPVVDDLGNFIGLVTRKSILHYLTGEKTGGRSAGAAGKNRVISPVPM